MKSHVSAASRFNRRLIPAMLVYTVVLLGCVWAIKQWHPAGAALVILSALPSLPILAAIAVTGRYLVDETDEFLRQRTAISMLIGTAILLAAITIYGLLANGGAIAVDAGIGLWGFPLWCAAWGLARCVLGWRDLAETDA